MCSISEPQHSPADEDEELRAAVLRLLLVEHPALLTQDELVRELSAAEASSAADRIRGAIRDLVGYGLVNVSGMLIVPSRAALAFDRLEID